MRTWTALALLLLLARPARADVSDSGSLTISGQGIIAGTMTVQGNAFSVGGSSFSVSASSVGIRTASPQAALDVRGSAQFGDGAAKSTFTAAGLLKLPASGIQWADGTTSTTAVASSGGNAILTATQTWSGMNTHAGVAVFSTASYHQNPWLGGGSAIGISTATVGGVIAWSVDGAVQSSGCIMAMTWDNTRGMEVITSTTTDYTNFSGVTACVLYEGCAPNTYCKCITKGIVRVLGNSASIANQMITTSTTRCNSSNNSNSTTLAACANNYCNGMYQYCDSSNPRRCVGMMFGP